MSAPVISLNVIGEDVLTRLLKNVSIDVTEKVESTIILNNSSQSVDFSFITEPSIFIFEGTGFDLEITDSLGITLTFPVSGFFSMVLNPINSISSISVSTSLVVDTVIGVRVYNNV